MSHIATATQVQPSPVSGDANIEMLKWRHISRLVNNSDNWLD